MLILYVYQFLGFIAFCYAGLNGAVLTFYFGFSFDSLDGMKFYRFIGVTFSGYCVT